MFKALRVLVALCGVQMALVGAAQANVVGACNTSAVTITAITKSDGGSTVYAAPPAVNATACVPVTGQAQAGNDVGTLLPGDNRGVYGDGLLNGGTYQVGQNPPVQPFDPVWLVNPSKYLDLDNNGSYTDPGWIRLGGYDNGISYETVTNAQGVTRSVSDFLTLTFSQSGDGKSGSWGLNTNTDIVSAVQNFLGRSTFDHLAIILKGGNGYVVYDFDFGLLAQGLPSFNFLTAYSFAGTWATTDLVNNGGQQAGLSHMSIWARDPVATLTNEVPEPGVLALVGVALAGLGLARRR